MSKEIIKLRNISKKYEGNGKKISVLSEIDLIINKGELVSLNGPSGSGKSTLLHIIALLDSPSSGEVFFKKKSFTKSSEYEKNLVRKKGISIIYQQNNLLSDFTALENVAIPLLNNDYTWKEAKKKLIECCF
jgi:lipoprotein-releasing system ATP-binding protein